jgi:hypothetical protein
MTRSANPQPALDAASVFLDSRLYWRGTREVGCWPALRCVTVRCGNGQMWKKRIEYEQTK